MMSIRISFFTIILLHVISVTHSQDLEVNGGNILQTPSEPSLVGNLGIGSSPWYVYVSGRYAYVVDSDSDDLKVIDVSDPSAPSLAGSLGIGSSPRCVYVSGRYAYVVDVDSDDLKVIDVSDPSAPSLAGSSGIGSTPRCVYVSGRYAYVVDSGSDDFKVIDVSNPSVPSLVGFLGIGSAPRCVYVSGRYAYVIDGVSRDLKVIDVSDPSAPSLVGFLGIGFDPTSVYVSGRYAYVIDGGSNDLKVIDVSDPSAPSLAGSLDLGTLSSSTSVFVSGRYAYIVDTNFDDLKVIDVSDPSDPSLAGSLGIGSVPNSVYVSGRFAYVVDAGSQDLKVIDVSGGEMTSLMAHSLEAGNLQVRNDIIAQGQLQVTGGINVGNGGIFADGDVSAQNLSLHGEILGSVFIVDESDDASRARLALWGREGAFDVDGAAQLQIDGLRGSTSADAGRILLSIGRGNEGAAISSRVAAPNSTTDGANLIFSTSSDGVSLFERMRIMSTGEVAIGTTSANDALEGNGDIDATGCVQTDDTGMIGGDCLSDRRLKKNIHDLASQLPLMMNLNPVTYEWRDPSLGLFFEIGLIAQEVEEVIPKMVKTDPDGIKRIRYDVTLQLRMLKALQEQQDIIVSQSQEIEALNRRLASLERMILDANER